MKKRRLQGKRAKRVHHETALVDGVPFVPDLPLLEELAKKPTPEEIAAIGATLATIHRPSSTENPLWAAHAKIEGLR